MTDPYEFPTDFADQGEAPATAFRWTVAVIALATVGLGLLNPSAIDGWIGDLPPGPVTVRLAAVADAWQDAADRIGLDAGHARLHSAWKAAERADWSGRQPVEMADASGRKS
jgi:hypothetical protein